MVIAGVGCRRGTSAAAIEAVIAAALARAALAGQELAGQELAGHALDAVATAAFKGNEAGITAVAAARGVPLILIARADLERANGRAAQSRRVARLTGVGSIAEAAALAAGGPAARLLVRRIAIGPATCALALAETTRTEGTP